MSVAIATRVYGSEVLVGLIRFYRKNPGSQVEAARALDLDPRLVSKNLQVLEQAAVVIREVVPEDARKALYRVDEQRARELLDALRSYSLED